MRRGKDLVKRQYYPETTIEAVKGLNEFLEGNMFQANFDRVQAQLLAHFDRVSKRIETRADEIEENVNQKIAEFDETIETANEKMESLESVIEETQKAMEENDVPTRDEVSANVIDQIGGSESAILKKELLVDGTEGTGARDDNGTLVQFSQTDYDDLNSEDKYVRSETIIDGRGAEIHFYFKVIETLEKRRPYLFEGCKTIGEKVTKYKSIVKKVTLSSAYRGYGYVGNTLGYKARSYIKAVSSNTFWGLDSTSNQTSGFRENTHVFNSTQTAQVDTQTGGYVIPIASKLNVITESGAISDGVTPAWVEVKDIRLTVEIEANGRTVIESIVAHYHGENFVSKTEDQSVNGKKDFIDGISVNGQDVATIEMTKETFFTSNEISNLKGTASGVPITLNEAAIVSRGLEAHARRGEAAEANTIYFNEEGTYLVELLWSINSGTATRKYVYLDFIKHGTNELLFRSGIGKINGFSYTSSVPGGGIFTVAKDEGIDILLKTNVEDLIAGVKINYIKISKILEGA